EGDIRLVAVTLHRYASSPQWLAFEGSDDTLGRRVLGCQIGLEPQLPQSPRRFRSARDLTNTRERRHERRAQLGRVPFNARKDASQTFAREQDQIVALSGIE